MLALGGELVILGGVILGGSAESEVGKYVTSGAELVGAVEGLGHQGQYP